MNADENNRLETVATDVREIKEAVLGNERIGLPGLVEDVRALKDWRNSINLRVAGISGGVAVVVAVGALILKAIFH